MNVTFPVSNARYFYALVIAIAIVVGSCGEEADSDGFPSRLNKLGVFVGNDPTLPAEGVHAYAPTYPLWSNGSTKSRMVRGPEGGAAPDPNAIMVGTLFIKTFSFEGNPVETRVIRIGDEGPEYGVYLWNEAGDDAELLSGDVPVIVSASFEEEDVEHEVPSHLQCAGCHEAPLSPVLGYTTQQLTGTLPVSIAESDREVVGYALGNCAHCHNGSGRPNASFDLSPDVFLANTINQDTQSSASGIGVRVIPGDPDNSALLLAFQRDSEEFEAMPPLGVQLRDEGAVTMFHDWIEQLEVEE